MKLINSSKHTEKRSKFFGYFYQVADEAEAQSIVEDLWKQNKKAAHVCWAAVIDDQQIFKNDGEVGNPANTILELLKSNNKHSHMLAVVRFFGGVKLGPGGVKRAFKKAAMGCLN